MKALLRLYEGPIKVLSTRPIKAVTKLDSGGACLQFQAQPRLYQGCIKALLRLYQGSIKALLIGSTMAVIKLDSGVAGLHI